MFLLDRFPNLFLFFCIIWVPFMGCSDQSTKEKEKAKAQKELSVLIESAIEETVKDLPEVSLIEKSVRIIPSKDTLSFDKVICQVYLLKKDPNPRNFTDYTDKLIKLRVISKVKEKLVAENKTAEPYFDIVFLSSN